MSKELKEEIKAANNAVLSTVRDEAPVITKTMSDKDLLDLIPEDGYQGFLSGWLMAKGISVVGLDCSKETNTGNV